MEGTYPDGYKMTYTDPTHFPTLTDPSGRTGTWDGTNSRWVDPSGSPMPQGWGNDHVPMDPKPG